MVGETQCQQAMVGRSFFKATVLHRRNPQSGRWFLGVISLHLPAIAASILAFPLDGNTCTVAGFR